MQNAVLCQHPNYKIASTEYVECIRSFVISRTAYPASQTPLRECWEPFPTSISMGMCNFRLESFLLVVSRDAQ